MTAPAPIMLASVYNVEGLLHEGGRNMDGFERVGAECSNRCASDDALKTSIMVAKYSCQV